MDTITREHELAHSQNIVTDNIEKLKQLFPTVFTEGKVDFDALRSVLGDYVDNENERYQFTWKGKAQALREAHKTSTGTLRPCPEESVNWDSTQNLYIEGDNLEVLKLLQKSYHGRVKMIYIDPPYNTGKDFVYKDNYKDNLKNYLELTEQGKEFGTNSETSGRYHSNWLNMMYPRLKLARNLLREDGAIFISIDDNEIENLRKVCEDIFGEENFVCSFVWQKKYAVSNDDDGVAAMHDYILCFRKSSKFERNLLPRTDKQLVRYKNIDNDHRGDWASDNYVSNKSKDERPTLWYPIKHPRTGHDVWPDESAVWRYSYDKHLQLEADGRLYWGPNQSYLKPRIKRFLSEIQGGLVPSTWLPFQEVGHNDEGQKETAKLIGKKIFSTPKPVRLIEHFLKIGTSSDDIVMDLFSGSASTAHAVMKYNTEDDRSLKYIMVQLPELTDKSSDAYKAGYKTIAEIGKERIRQVIQKVKTENPEKAKDLDLGFKVLKLDSSNIKEWDPTTDDLQKTLYDSINNIKSERAEADLLYEILLKYGLDLTLPIKEYQIAGNNVYSIGHGALLVCLSPSITKETVGGIGELKEDLAPEVCRVVLRDNGFKDDVAKTNAMQVLKRYGIEDVKSI